METLVNVVIIGGALLFMKDLVAKLLWSFIIYLSRGELNHDKDESTPDKYLRINPNTGTVSTRFVIKYTLFGVHWGFFYKGKWVYKFSSWLDWAEDRKNRFPAPVDIDELDESSVLKLLKTGR